MPDGTAEILAAAEVNRHVQCAVFKEAVEAAFGVEYNRRQTEIAGKAAVTFWDGDRTTSDMRPKAGRGSAESHQEARVTQRQADAATEAMATPVRTHFT